MNQHFHLGFEIDHIEPCFAHEQAYPSYVVEEDNCWPVIIPKEPRTYVTTCNLGETLRVRMYGLNNNRTKFNLTHIRVAGNNNVDLCFNHSLNPIAEWEAGAPPADDEEAGWYCWESVGPGYLDLGPWVSDVAVVKITAAGDTNFSIDDLKFSWC